MHLFDNYIMDERTRYEAHTLIYTPDHSATIELRGFLAAAIYAALIVDTDEGDARGIVLDNPEHWEDFFERYEKEVLRDNYVQIALGPTTLTDLCPNKRLLAMAMDMTVTYMQHLVRMIFRDHIWEVMPWKMPFSLFFVPCNSKTFLIFLLFSHFQNSISALLQTILTI